MSNEPAPSWTYNEELTPVESSNVSFLFSVVNYYLTTHFARIVNVKFLSTYRRAAQVDRSTMGISTTVDFPVFFSVWYNKP